MTTSPWVASRVVQWQLERVRASPRNSKLHPEEQVAALAASIKRFGFTQPLLVTADGDLIAGDGRLQAARRAGLKRVPVIVVDHLSEDEARALRIADNRLAELGEWNLEALGRELADITQSGVDVAGLGWSGEELEKLLADAIAIGAEPLAGAREPSDATESARDREPLWKRMVGDKPAVRVGELWTVGRHRLLVGDCRRKGDVERALGELTCELVVTDPPYCAAGVDDESRGRGTWGEIANDNLSARGYAALMDAWLERAAPRATYAFTDWRMWNALLDAHERAGLAAVAQLVWDKASAGLGAVWRTQHELVLHAARGRRSKVMGSPDRTSVLEFARTGNQYHWTEKPVELIVAILREDQLNGRSGAVVDFFAGSCTTLLAAERLGRPGVGVELVPLVAQVGLRRLELETGARAILEGDGRTLDQVADERSGS